jgi:CheY-like chemotaxis protein
VVERLLAVRGHRVDAVADGPTAAAALDAGLRPDLILLDRSIPGWPIRRTLDELRRRAGRAPIVFFTGQDVPSEERALVQDVLAKPLSNDEFVRAVERWLSSA